MTRRTTVGRAVTAALLVAGALVLAGAPRPAAAEGEGYWLLGGDGGVFTFGAAPFYGSTGGMRLNQPVVGMAPSSRGGYWLVASDGGVFSFGDAPFYGSTGDMRLNQPVVGMAEAPTGGYWLVASDGGIFSFGDARFSGSTGNIRLNSPIVGMAATATGAGYWLVAADGGVFAFGDAPFFGSAADKAPTRPIVGIAARDDGQGYWVVAADGSLYAFGTAQLFGTVQRTASPIVGITPTPSGSGYWLAAADGTVSAFGDAPLLGSLAGRTLNRPIIGVAGLGLRSGFLAESRQPGTYTETIDQGVSFVRFQGGVVTERAVVVKDCFCSERLLFSTSIQGDGPAQRFVVVLTNTSGVPMQLPGGLRVEVTGTGQPGTWRFSLLEPSVTRLENGSTATLTVPVPPQADGQYFVSATTVVVLE